MNKTNVWTFETKIIESIRNSSNLCVRFQVKLRESKIFSSLLRKQNLVSSRGFVKISASWFSGFTWHNLISPFASWCLRKWCVISMCLVLECCTRLLASLMALSLSHSNGILLNSQPKSLKVCFIHSNWAQQAPVAMYSALAVESAKQFYFLELHDTRDRPRN
jgi:hypothetical protein